MNEYNIGIQYQGEDLLKETHRYLHMSKLQTQNPTNVYARSFFYQPIVTQVKTNVKGVAFQGYVRQVLISVSS